MTEIKLPGTPEDLQRVGEGLQLLADARKTDPTCTFFMVVVPFDEQEYFMNAFEKARKEREALDVSR